MSWSKELLIQVSLGVPDTLVSSFSPSLNLVLLFSNKMKQTKRENRGQEEQRSKVKDYSGDITSSQDLRHDRKRFLHLHLEKRTMIILRENVL